MSDVIKKLFYANNTLQSMIGYDINTIMYEPRMIIPYSNDIKKELEKISNESFKELSEIIINIAPITPVTDFIIGLLKKYGLNDYIKPTKKELEAAKLMLGNQATEDEIMKEYMAMQSTIFKEYFPFNNSGSFTTEMMRNAITYIESTNNAFKELGLKPIKPSTLKEPGKQPQINPYAALNNQAPIIRV